MSTLSALKGRDPKIYNKDEVLFGDVVRAGNEDNDDHTEESASKKKQPSSREEKKMTLKDYERKIISEEGLLDVVAIK